MSLVAGVDPGTVEGAFVLWEDASLRFWGVWSSVKSGYRVTTAEWVRSCQHVGEVGCLLANALGPALPELDLLVIEGLFVVGNKQGGHKLIESVGSFRTGLLFGGLRWAAEARPVAVSRSKTAPPGWRKQVLGLPDTMGDKQAEEAAIEWAMTRGVLPRGLTRKEQGAFAEAYAISYARPHE